MPPSTCPPPPFLQRVLRFHFFKTNVIQMVAHMVTCPTTNQLLGQCGRRMDWLQQELRLGRKLV